MTKTFYILGYYHTITNHTIYICRRTTSTVYFICNSRMECTWEIEIIVTIFTVIFHHQHLYILVLIFVEDHLAEINSKLFDTEGVNERWSSTNVKSTMIIYEIICTTSLMSSSSLFDADAQDMCPFDLSFALKDLFIGAGSKLTFSTIIYSDIAFSKLFVHPKRYGNLW